MVRLTLKELRLAFLSRQHSKNNSRQSLKERFFFDKQYFGIGKHFCENLKKIYFNKTGWSFNDMFILRHNHVGYGNKDFVIIIHQPYY